MIFFVILCPVGCDFGLVGFGPLEVGNIKKIGPTEEIFGNGRCTNCFSAEAPLSR